MGSWAKSTARPVVATGGRRLPATTWHDWTRVTSSVPTARCLDAYAEAIRHGGRERDMRLDPLFDVSWRYDLTARSRAV